MRTKEEIKEYKRKWYLANRERTREHDIARIKDYKQSHKEEIKVKSKEYYKKNKDKSKSYYEANKEKIKKRQKEFRTKNWNKIRKRERESQIKKRQNSFYKFKDSIRNRIRASIKSKGHSKNSKTFELLGCNYEKFKNHIESKFESWMTWENHGKYNGEINYGWDIDHIIPISAAKNEADVIKLNHYTNFQPLCSYVNRVEKRNIIKN